MRILVAEDDSVWLSALETTLGRWGYEVETVRDGAAAWEKLQAEDPPDLAVLDWMMPELEGVEVCRRVRGLGRAVPTYLILLSARGERDDIVAGLEQGADDYLIKPVDLNQLRARLKVGTRILQLQRSLADRVKELTQALHKVKQLQGLLPICSYCKKIRDDKNYWQQVDSYITNHSEARFSHSICPDCYERVVKPELDQFLADR